MGYLLDSFKKFKADALSKGIYDFLKWILVGLVAFIPTYWIPYVKNFILIQLNIPIYGIVISLSVIVIANTLIVAKYFRTKIKAIKLDTYKDELTGLKNNKAFTEHIENLIQKYQSKAGTFSVIFMDVDDFKRLNETTNHWTADQILKKLGELLSNDKRITDETFRQYMRGDEFIVICEETNLNGANLAAERKRKLISNTLFYVEGSNYSLTVSCGVTEFKSGIDTSQTIMERAENALKIAKKIKGKNNTKSLV